MKLKEKKLHSVPENRHSLQTDFIKNLRKAKPIGLSEDSSDEEMDLGESSPALRLSLPCLTELREMDMESGVVFRSCLIDYTSCTESRCIRKLV